MSKHKIAMLAVAAMAYAGAAYADKPAGDTCATKLNADGKEIYAATMAATPTPETLRATVEKETRSLAMGGKIGRGSARENATEAGECVRAALQ